MYIVAIGWLYVILMMAVTADSFAAGVFTLVAYGLLPLSIVLWLLGTPIRKKRRAREANLDRAADQPVNAGDGAHPKPDQ